MTDHNNDEQMREDHHSGSHGYMRRIMYVLWGIAVVLAVMDFIHHRHTTFRFENFPAFYGLYAFLACTILTMGAKALRAIVKRGERYYER